MYNIPLQQNNLKKRKKYGTKVEKNEGEGGERSRDPEKKKKKKKKRGKKNRINYYYVF